MEATGATVIDMKAVAKYGIANNLYKPEPYDPVKAYAQRLSRSSRAEHYTDPQGREVRKKHCYTVVDTNGQRRWLWVDITSAQPDQMQLAFQQRRQSALGDVIQLAKDIASFNENNTRGAQLEFDFNFNEDLDELSQPTDYPEDPDA